MPSALPLLLAFGLWIGHLSAVWAADVIVMQANGVSLQAGQPIDGAEPLSLPAGATVTLITSQGRIIRLAGPYNDVPVPAGSGDGDRLSQSLAALLQGNQTNATTLGVTRSVAANAVVGATVSTVSSAAPRRSVVSGVRDPVDEAAVPPDPWVLDVSTSGVRCVHGTGHPVVFWRPHSDVAAPVRVELGDGIWRGETEWPSGYARLEGAPTMPQVDGERYQVTVGDTRVDLVLHVIPRSVSEPAVLAAWMVERACRPQAVALLRAGDGS